MTEPIALPEGRHDPMVYFIRLGSRVKIGYTTNIAQRVANLSLHPRFVALLMPGSFALEAELHRHFAAERETGTEWFEYSKRVHAYVTSNRGEGRNTFELQDEEALVKAERIVTETWIASASMLKREMRISWGRAQRLMSELERRGIVGSLEGPGCSRAVLVRQPVPGTPKKKD